MVLVPHRAVIYARISSDPRGLGLGVERQIADCRKLAVDLGWAVTDVYTDNDVSAYSGVRPQYSQMVEDIKGGLVDGVLSWRPDRLYRQPRELEELIVLCDAAGGIPIANVTGVVDLLTPEGRAGARMHGVMASYESDIKSERIRRKHLDKATKGEVSGGGTRPYGYTQDRLHLVPDEAAAIREAASRVIAGDSLRSVFADFNERGITTSTGGLWTLQTMGRMLGSARISGRREHHRQIVAQAAWPAVISAADSDRLRDLRSRSAGSGPSGRTPRRYLLTGGLLRCGLCDTQMFPRPRVDGVRRYVCASGPGFGGCGRMATVAEPVESLVAQAVLLRLDTPQLAEALTETRRANAEHDQLHTELSDDEAMLHQLAADYGAKTISHREWLAASQPIRQRTDAANRRLSRISPTHRIDEYVGRSTALRDAWADLPLTRQQAIIRLILDHVVVNPAVKGRNTFDLSRFTPIWRL